MGQEASQALCFFFGKVSVGESWVTGSAGDASVVSHAVACGVTNL